MKATSITALSIAIVVLAGVLLTPSGAQNAAAPAGTRVAVCDFGQVYNNYEKTKILQTRLDRELKAIKDEDERKAKEIEGIKRLLDSGNLKEGTADYDEQFNQFVNKSTAYRAWIEGQKARSQRWHLKMTTDMFIEIKAAIAEVAKERGVDIVLQTHQLNFKSNDVNELFQKVALHKVLYNNPSKNVDLTEAVQIRVNDTYRKAPRER